MRLRHAVILGAIAASLVILAIVSANVVAASFDALFNGWIENGASVTTDEFERRQQAAQAQMVAFQPLVGWALLGAVVALTGAVVLLVLRSREREDQAGSASASTASREISRS